jgi:hypothetical protein
MRAVKVEQADGATLVAKNHQVFAEQPDAMRQIA